MAGLQSDIYAAISITWFAAFLALVMRLKARRMMKTKLWLDDYFAIVALFFITSYCSVIIYWTHSFKLGQSLSMVSDPVEASRIQDRSRLLLWICELFYASSIAFCKIAILCFYWRIFQHTSIRYAIIGLLLAICVWIIIRTFMVIFHCVPVQAYWDKSIQDAKCPLNEANFFFGTILIHTTMDCIILILPVIEVMKMTLPLSQRLAVVALFTSGTIHGGKHDVVYCGNEYGSLFSLSSHASTHLPPLSTWTLNNRRVSSSTYKFDQCCTTSHDKNSYAVEETGIQKVWTFWFA
ncbi:hypothetical protein FLONG3_4792 [Fusarium longipes]|uniref:Rhodopsin domain-containing protein n=1 Tax=Fusarium longipes TaxID=694270 RepID=A0A395SYH0_9HYPO|nr:hypothetical protein FLONG3_4792 [Fusarium longipes]